MEIFKKSGTKERLFEMMSKVNKVNLNESFHQLNNDNEEFEQPEIPVDNIEQPELPVDNIEQPELPVDGDQIMQQTSILPPNEPQFDNESIVSGLAIELENYPDPNEAFQVVMNNLNSDPYFYFDSSEDHDSSLENQILWGKSGDSEDFSFEPKNVGDMEENFDVANSSIDHYNDKITGDDSGINKLYGVDDMETDGGTFNDGYQTPDEEDESEALYNRIRAFQL